MYATHRPAVVPPPRPKRDYLASFSSALIISTLWHSCRNACIYIYIYTYIFLSLFSPYPSSRVPYRASSSLLYSFTVSRPVRPPLFSALLSLSIHSCAIRDELFARAFHSRSLVLSLSFVGRNTLLSVLRRVGRSLASSLARSRSFHPAPRPAHPPDARFGLRFLRALRLFLQPPASVLCSGYAQRARRAGARNTRCGHVDSLRSLARLASPRLALPRFACGASSSSAAWSVLSSSSSSLSLDVAAALLLIVRAAAGRVRTCPM